MPLEVVDLESDSEAPAPQASSSFDGSATFNATDSEVTSVEEYDSDADAEDMKLSLDPSLSRIKNTGSFATSGSSPVAS